MGAWELMRLLRHWSDSDDASTEQPAKTKCFHLSDRLRAREFVLDETPVEVARSASMEAAITNVHHNHLAPFAAQLIDSLLAVLSPLHNDAKATATMYKAALDGIMFKVNRVVVSPDADAASTTKHALLQEALVQVKDLVERGEARVADLQCLEAAKQKQCNVRTLNQRRALASVWTEANELAFIDSITLRKPDALVQRYMNVRPSVRYIGINATEESVVQLRHVDTVLEAAVTASASALEKQKKAAAEAAAMAVRMAAAKTLFEAVIKKKAASKAAKAVRAAKFAAEKAAAKKAAKKAAKAAAKASAKKEEDDDDDAATTSYAAVVVHGV